MNKATSDSAQLKSAQLKEVLKLALVELLQEQRELFSEIISEAIEDVAMARAIHEEKDSESVSREEIFAILDQ